MNEATKEYTLADAQQAVAEKYGYNDWDDLLNTPDIFHDFKHDEAAEYYAKSRYAQGKQEGESDRWISLSEKQPEENETVWACNKETGYVALACRVYLNNEGWFWAISNGIIYSQNGKIVSECGMDDDYDFTHFHKLPSILNCLKED